MGGIITMTSLVLPLVQIPYLCDQIPLCSHSDQIPLCIKDSDVVLPRFATHSAANSDLVKMVMTLTILYSHVTYTCTFIPVARALRDNDKDGETLLRLSPWKAGRTV